MILTRLIAPPWLLKTKVLEGIYTPGSLHKLNKEGYNVYYLPNYPSNYDSTRTIDGRDIDVFNYVFVDMDLKDKKYSDKDSFIAKIGESNLPPTKVIDSGNGIHVYWRITDLDAHSYLKLSRRLMRLFNTDEAVGQIFQLMRLPGYFNTKVEGEFKLCEALYEDENTTYTCEEMNKLLPLLTKADAEYCEAHYNRTYGINQVDYDIDDKMPPKFGQLLHSNEEVKKLWSEIGDDRSSNDFRLGHLMFSNGFTKKEAMTVLFNSAKALTRSPIHRINYAANIVEKIWTYELTGDEELNLSQSIKDILGKTAAMARGVPFRCYSGIDNTVSGFRLGQVLGLVAGSGVGKTAFALNMFKWFCERNPDYHHFFIPLEQPSNEIAERWDTMCQGDTSLHDKVHVMSNYDDNGEFRHLSLVEIETYLVKWQEQTGKKIGCVVVDHIGALKKKGSKDENYDLMTICHSMKAFAIRTNTFLIMQSQTSREKAGIGDLELNKDAAYGTLFFESYCDYLVTLWQPLKRCHEQPDCPTVTAFKFCKIRHKKAKKDVIKEDVAYYMEFDSENEILKDMTQETKTAFAYYLPLATNKRKADRKTDIIEYKSVPYNSGDENGIPAQSGRDRSRH